MASQKNSKVKNNSIKAPVIKEFQFYARHENLYPSLNEILEVIKNATAHLSDAELIAGKCKLILTELLTNALKHSLAAQSTIGVIITAHKIIITKKDSGRPFYLPESEGREEICWPVSKSLKDEEIIIYEDELCTLHALIESENRLIFFTEDLPISVPPRPVNILEHFGIMILTKSSDEFIYEYNPVTQTNLFQSTVIL